MKRLILILWLMSTVIILYAQEAKVEEATKPGCNPKACGPHDTKKQEAAVISTLREDLKAIDRKWLLKNKEKDSYQSISSKIEKGGNDGESLIKLIMGAEILDASLRFRYTHRMVVVFSYEGSNAQKVQTLKKHIALLESVITSI
ncbi:MAG: hypothetical protein KI790_04115 [Cyclobacteriaceae bacterium]|nr:hypothetical protein [Cyclobacteriaceae bacterium HetDA_MAG_MS6]